MLLLKNDLVDPLLIPPPYTNFVAPEQSPLPRCKLGVLFKLHRHSSSSISLKRSSEISSRGQFNKEVRVNMGLQFGCWENGSKIGIFSFRNSAIVSSLNTGIIVMWMQWDLSGGDEWGPITDAQRDAPDPICLERADSHRRECQIKRASSVLFVGRSNGRGTL